MLVVLVLVIINIMLKVVEMSPMTSGICGLTLWTIMCLIMVVQLIYVICEKVYLDINRNSITDEFKLLLFLTFLLIFQITLALLEYAVILLCMRFRREQNVPTSGMYNIEYLGIYHFSIEFL